MSSHKLVVFESDPFRARIDFQTTHKEADVIIPHQVVNLPKIGKTQITVLADDKDIFVLLIYAYYENNLTLN